MYLNKLFILKRLQETNAHLGQKTSCTVGSAGLSKHRFSAHRTQSYIYAIRQKQTIIHLDETIASLRRACHVIQFIIESNGHLLFINTSSRYNKMIKQTAHYTNQSYINHKWIGGFLTNWKNMQSVQQQFHEAATWFFRPTSSVPTLNLVSNSNSQQLNNSVHFSRPLLFFSPKYKKMQKCFEGLQNSTPHFFNQGPADANRAMRKRVDVCSAPDCVIIFNANQNSTAIYEAHNNQIPIIALVDSQIPDKLYSLITYPIPVNCESTYFIYLFCNCIIKTILKSKKFVA